LTVFAFLENFTMKILIKYLSALLFLFLLSPSTIHAEESLEETLRREKIKSYDVPIHLQSREWLIEQFGPGQKYPLNLSRTTRNIIWQTREKIRQGEVSPIQGIIRTFWYTHIKPVFARTDSLSDDTDQSSTLNREFVDLVRTNNIMRYKDMGFLNKNAPTTHIGKNWHVMLIGEKHGKFTVLDTIAKEIQSTVLTLGGQPSLLSAEYFTDEYKSRGIDIRKSMYLIFIVDYDPSGWIIQKNVIRNLKFFGVKNIHAINFILPNILTPEELELAKIPLSTKPKEKAKNDKWMALSGGINGQRYGFESDSIPFERLKAKIIEAATPFVGDPENIRLSNAARDLGDALNHLVQVRLGLENSSRR